MFARILVVGLLVGVPARSAAERPGPPGVDPGPVVDKVLPFAVEHYKWFHAHPELSGEEKQTAARLAAALEEIGLEVHRGIGGHGVVGILRSGPAPRRRVVLYRADMDALPVTEATGLPFASKNPGVMHACGHDIHMATALGTLRALAALKDRWSGTVLFVGQPAEEIGRGARDMLADKRFRRILRDVGTPAVALAVHDDAGVPAGSVSLRPGYVNANVDSVDIVLQGAGGHGARPHETIDPIVIGAEVVLSLQTIVSRRLPAGEPAVVTVGRFDAGTKHNIIPESATLLLTVRSYAPATRKLLLEEIERIAVNVARAHRAPRRPTVTVRDEGTPAAYNDPAWTGRLEALFMGLLGDKRVLTHEPSLGGEDFGRYAKTLGIPGVMVRLGAVDPRAFAQRGRKRLPGLHSPEWAPAYQPTLRTGIRAMTAAILHALAEP